jgi:hypothetical protein
LLLANNDQPLAAEPGFHSYAPQSGGTIVMFLRHTSDYLPEVVEQQSENGLALA